MYGSQEYKEYWLNRVQYWELKFCLFPKRCHLSKKRMWFQRAYKGDSYVHGPGEPIVDTYWIDPAEFVLWKLKS